MKKENSRLEQNVGECKDYYGERIQVGDKVIPICSEALILGVEGKIQKILKYEEYYFITIIDENGRILENVNGVYYTTPERFFIKENEQ